MLVLTASLASAPATARPIPPVVLFDLKASDGYTASLGAIDGKVRLVFTKRRNGVQEEVEYLVRGTVTRRGLRARFGSLGRISVKFTPARGKGNRGVFKGTIRFRGEGGYVELDARRAKGALIGGSRRPRLSTGGSAVASAETVFGVLEAQAKGRILLAIASHPDEGDLPGFVAAAQDRGGGMEITRKVAVLGSADTFSFEDNLSTATIRPPSPFAGSATFTRNADGSGSWSGDLVVDLPGRADVPMVGPEFKVELRHDLFGEARAD